MNYRLIVTWNDYTFYKNLNLDKSNMEIYNIERSHPILSIMCNDNKNLLSISLYFNEELILEKKNILIPEKLYKIYKLGNKTLYCHCMEFNEYVVSIDINSYFGMKYFKSIFVYRKE
jgi:hypothetical protein